MKKILSIFTISFMLFGLSVNVFASTAPKEPNVEMQASGIVTESSNDIMGMVTMLQEEQRIITEHLRKAWQLQAEGAEEVPEEMDAYLTMSGVSSDDWKDIIAFLEKKLDEVNLELQEAMVYLQKYVDQQDSYMKMAKSQNGLDGVEVFGVEDAVNRDTILWGIAALAGGFALGCVVTSSVKKKR